MQDLICADCGHEKTGFGTLLFCSKCESKKEQGKECESDHTKEAPSVSPGDFKVGDRVLLTGKGTLRYYVNAPGVYIGSSSYGNCNFVPDVWQSTGDSIRDKIMRDRGYIRTSKGSLEHEQQKTTTPAPQFKIGDIMLITEHTPLSAGLSIDDRVKIKREGEFKTYPGTPYEHTPTIIYRVECEKSGYEWDVNEDAIRPQ